MVDRKTIRTPGAGGPAFAKLVRASEGRKPIRVRVGAAEIDLQRDFDAALLRAVVDALSGETEL